MICINTSNWITSKKKLQSILYNLSENAKVFTEIRHSYEKKNLSNISNLNEVWHMDPNQMEVDGSNLFLWNSISFTSKNRRFNTSSNKSY